MPRKVRVATVAQARRGGPTIEANRKQIRGLIEQAAAEKPDIICLPETFLQSNVAYTDLADIAEPLPGPTTEMVARYAARWACYIICPLIAIHGDKYMNDAVLIDRQGQIAGVYSKIHPVVSGSEFKTLEKGITSASEAKVFDTDFGRIGIQICFDINWPGPWAELKREGAEIVFWPSGFDGGKLLNIHAWNNHYYVVSSVSTRHARIIDIMGEVLAETGRQDPVTVYTIDLDVGLFSAAFNETQIRLIRTKYRQDVTIRSLHVENFFTLESNRADLSLAELIEEFTLELADGYAARTERLQEAWRKGGAIPDLTPKYVGREQWL